ncbi:MAG TPA: hypothetical protein VFE78_21110, partial [Gemmataceae bacterium]|nr:hypothetical protein [Gemmataceae bacterium]
MSTVPAGAGQRYLRFAVPAVLAVCGAWAVVGTSPGQTGKAPGKATEPAQSQKRVAFSMDGKPWSSVFEWLSEQTGKPINTSHKPTGTFSFISPAGKKYTIPEVIDIINEGLLANSATQKYYLINRGQSFTLIPADEKVDPALIPQIDKVEDLAKHGETELVRINYQLKALVAEDTALEINRLMGPFGQVAPFAVANQLVLLDTVANLKRVIKTLDEIESETNAKSAKYAHPCKYVKCRDAERILTTLLGDPKAVMAAQAQAAQQARGGDRNRGFPGFPGMDRRDEQQQPQAALPHIRMHYVSCDENTNTVIVTGPANKVAQARDIMKDLDKPPYKDAKPLPLGPPGFQTYSVPAGNAEAIAKTLSEAFKTSPTVRISNAGTSTLIVWAAPADQEEIGKQILGGTEKSQTTALVPVGDLDPINVADTLAKMYGDPKNGAPFIGAQPERSAIVVKGSPAQVA